MFRLLLVMLVGLLSSCISSSRIDVPSQPPAQVEDRIVLDGVVMPLPDEPKITPQSLPPQQSMSPVARSLMDKAQGRSAAGDFESAANSLERALRIEPRNSLLWSRLADVRYAQKNWQQAIQLAAKSNTLAATDTNLRRQNWYMMANAYHAMGDVVSADKYRQKLSKL